MGPYDGDGSKMSVILDLKLWRYLRFKKDLNPKLLRRFLFSSNSMLRLLIKVDEKYGSARDLNEALLRRQPKFLHLLPLFLCFIFILVCFAWPFFPSRYLHAFLCFHLRAMSSLSMGERYYVLISNKVKKIKKIVN